MIPITHRNREIERLERELAESREECRRLRELLDKVLTGTGNLLSNHADFVNYVYPHGFKTNKPDEEFALDLRQEVIELGRNAFDLSVAEALAPKVGDK